VNSTRSRPDFVRPVGAGRTSFYRLAVDASESTREAEARARAVRRLHRQREILRPLGLLVIAAVAIGAINGQPALAAHGRGLAVAAALALFAAALAFAVRDRFLEQVVAAQAGVIAAMGAAGVALVALQPHGATELAGGAAVWMAVARLPLPLATTVAAATTLGLGLAEGLAGGSAATVTAAVLLCALLALVAYFIKQARASQETTELLLARLEDAREQQLEAAALAERGRIAGELHDVLAHALSGAALQLQGARKLAEREQASAELGAAIGRAGELVRDGLANARQAVGALRGEQLPGVDQLESLVAGFATDAKSDVKLTIEGSPRRLSTEASLALYRGAQEALTNVGRYAPQAATFVVLQYGSDRITLTIEDLLDEAKATTSGLAGVGGGNGLRGLRERLEQVGGKLDAGPTERGWRVKLEIPA
jgi:signal transduction histidine kinase